MNDLLPPHGTVQRFDRGCTCSPCWNSGHSAVPKGRELTFHERKPHARSHGIPEGIAPGAPSFDPMEALDSVWVPGYVPSPPRRKRKA